MNRSEVTEWIEKIVALDDGLCHDPPFTQKTVYWRGESMSLPRAVCGEKNGWNGDMLLVPVRSCGTPRCGNGHHYRWGTVSEARAHSAIPRDHKGAGNPNSKLDWDAVRHIRRVVADAPQWVSTALTEDLRETRGMVISHAEAMTRRELALKYGVTLRTIDDVVRNRKWKEEE
jgi:hypothetical protein